MKRLTVRTALSMIPTLIALGVPGAGCSTPSGGSDPVRDPEATPAPSPAPPAPSASALSNTTINAFLQRGTPTFIAGTAGDARADNGVDAQISVVQSQLFADAKIIKDTDVDATAGATAWPSNPVLYGGPPVNALVARVELGFLLSADKLIIGDETFSEADYSIVAVVPASDSPTGDRAHPEFLLFAGTGMPGVAGINANVPGGSPIVVRDAFGVLATGHWVRAKDGAVVAALDPQRGRRLAWRNESQPLAGGTAHISFLKDFPAAGEDEMHKACSRGLQSVVSKLGITKPAPVSVYVYPDLGSKKSLTGDGGSGHAVVAMRALHMAASGDALEHLMAHEATHVLAYDRFGPERTPLLAEGLAVWVSGHYQGKTLLEWKAAVRDQALPVTELLGAAFRRLPEPTSYPLAGLFVSAAIEAVGIDAFGQHLYGASPATWEEACRRAGTSADALQAAFAKSLAD